MWQNFGACWRGGALWDDKGKNVHMKVTISYRFILQCYRNKAGCMLA